MGFRSNQQLAIRYRGFLLLPQANNSWLVRPERSPMVFLPFRTASCSLAEVKAMVDLRLISNQQNSSQEAA